MLGYWAPELLVKQRRISLLAGSGLAWLNIALAWYRAAVKRGVFAFEFFAIGQQDVGRVLSSRGEDQGGIIEGVSPLLVIVAEADHFHRRFTRLEGFLYLLPGVQCLVSSPGKGFGSGGKLFFQVVYLFLQLSL